MMITVDGEETEPHLTAEGRPDPFGHNSAFPGRHLARSTTESFRVTNLARQISLNLVATATACFWVQTPSFAFTRSRSQRTV